MSFRLTTHLSPGERNLSCVRAAGLGSGVGQQPWVAEKSSWAPPHPGLQLWLLVCPPSPLLHWCPVAEALVPYRLGASHGPRVLLLAGTYRSPTAQDAILSSGCLCANHGHVKLLKQMQKGRGANKCQVTIR